ncbi:hypothetical protein ABCS02_09675 [Microbacterium sp. X-17]|uniref:LGFP repeat-containing protein n=1 Tax=Microbacterium sp. X-17 TaxID=3144404 RepID=UPI0031F529FB
MNARRLRLRAVNTLIAATFVLAAALVMTALTQPQSSASAAVGSAFQDGDIISDTNFFDSGSMSAADIQNFLNAQVPSCSGANGQPCLKDFSQDTQVRTADAYCGAMPGGRMTGAQIIAAAAQACGISPRVILVMLQKEQGLITDPSPDSWSYQAALGQSCPDTAACDPAYSGFFNQVFFGARQLRMYINRPDWYGYQLGWNNILYNPNTACGTKSVYIQNDATRALYIYTPYTPNQAALDNLYGTGDGCSSYGNRNFWRLYTDWFGDPTISFAVLGDMGARYRAIGGSASPIGPPIANEVCNWTPGLVNCYQNFRNGAISWTPSTGAWETYGDIRTLWSTLGFEHGALGYPTGAPVNTPGQAYQTFQGGTIGWSSGGGAFTVTGDMNTRWLATGATTGFLGAPTGPQMCGTKNNGCYQNFQNGAISWTAATGAWETYGDIRKLWAAQGFENGALGYPTAAPVNTPGLAYQTFQGGTIGWSSAGGAFPVTGDINTRWIATGATTGPLGAPVAAVVCAGDNSSCVQVFQSGRISWTPSAGAIATSGPVDALWQKNGGASGTLGAPTAAAVTASGASSQTFQNGSIGWSSASGAIIVTGDISARWVATGAAGGPLGAPTAPQACGTKNNGCYQNFQNGAISWTSATGAWETTGDLRSYWGSQGYENGALGYPTAAPVSSPTGSYQSFQGGTAAWFSGGTGAVIGDKISGRWIALGATAGPLGVPTGPQMCGTKDNGCYQNFQNGSISWTSATGAWETTGGLRSYWGSQGYENGVLGYPTAAPVSSPTGAYQSFQGGTAAWFSGGNGAVIGDKISGRWIALGATAGPVSAPIGPQMCGAKNNGCYQNFPGWAISWTAATGAWETYGDIRTVWAAQGYENGALGYPTAAPVNTPGQAYQTFQGGTIGWSSGNGAFAITGDINTRWIATGATTGPLGAPVGPQTCGTKSNGCYQNFQGGAISWTSTTGAWETYGDIRGYWARQGFENGPLGYPTGAVTTVDGGLSQQFQGGTVRWNAKTGVVGP